MKNKILGLMWIMGTIAGPLAFAEDCVNYAGMYFSSTNEYFTLEQDGCESITLWKNSLGPRADGVKTVFSKVPSATMKTLVMDSYKGPVTVVSTDYFDGKAFGTNWSLRPLLDSGIYYGMSVYGLSDDHKDLVFLESSGLIFTNPSMKYTTYQKI